MEDINGRYKENDFMIKPSKDKKCEVVKPDPKDVIN